MAQVTSRNEWIFGNIKSNILNDKEAMLKANIMQMLNKTTRMFKYKNLPKTIRVRDIETYLQVGGYCIWAQVNGELYVFTGGLGGEPSPYYLPTIAIVANPALRFNKSMVIDKECVVMSNDFYRQGLMDLFNKYGGLLVEAELSLKNAILNARVPALIQADNDKSYRSAVEFFDKIVKGENYGIIASKEMFEGIKSTEYYKQNYISHLIEAIQYIKGSWYNEIGIKAAFNMKRESLTESETALNDDILYPSIDTMLECRRQALKRVNDMFGTNIEVELDSVWAINREQEDLDLEHKKAIVENLQSETEQNEVEVETEEVQENETN